MQDFRSINREHFYNYFLQGCKLPTLNTMLGLELEHFIIDTNTKESISYYGEQGVEAVLKAISTKFEKQILSQGHLIGLANSEYTITLEPAAQLEISISPQDSIADIERIYESFLAILCPELNKRGYLLARCGYQPKSKAKELKLIPKSRYEFMNSYFETVGEYGAYMMRGTASTQVSIDYCSEADYSDKYRIAYYLTPFFTFLSDNSPIFEGKKNEHRMNRITIWDSVDKKRVDISPYLKNGTLDFSDYIDFLYHAPVIVKKVGDEEEYTDLTIGELALGKEFTAEEVEHYLSMVFPAVRLKKYIEIRMADSMPIFSVKAYLAIIKGIFANISSSTILVDKLAQQTENSVQLITRELMKSGIEARFGTVTAKEILKQMFDIAYDGVSDNEKSLLLSVKQNILEKGTILGDRK